MDTTSAPVCPSVPCPLDHHHDDHEDQTRSYTHDQDDDEDIPSPDWSVSTFSDVSSEKSFMPILDRVPIEVVRCLNAHPSDFTALRGPSAPNPPLPPPGPWGPKTFSLPHSPQQSSDIYRAIWDRLFGIANVMPYFWPSTAGPSSNEVLAPPSHEEALDLLEANDWSLVKAQAAFPFHRAKQTKLAAAKGKSPASSRSGSPSLATDPSSSSSFAFLGPEYTQDRKGRPCGHWFRKGEAIWRCRDCAIDDTCVQCAPCFESSAHEGHDVVFSVCATEGGVCDCGDEEAWRREVGCRYHSNSDTGTTDRDAGEPMPQTESSQSQSAPSLTTPREMDRRLLDEIFDNIHAKPIDADFVDSVQQVLNEYMSFILATIDHAPEEQNLFMQSFRRFNQKNARDLIWNQEDLETWSTRYDEEKEEDKDIDGEEEGLVPYMKFKDIHSDDPDLRSHNEQETIYLKRQYNERLCNVTVPAFKRRLKEVRRLRRQGKIPADTQLVDPLLASGDESAIASYHAPPGHYPTHHEVDGSDMDTFDSDEHPNPVFDDEELGRRIARARGEQPAPTRPLRTWPFKPRKYALILWNDEKHTFKDVIDTVKDAIGISDEEARGVAERVDTRGREVLIVSDSVEKLVSAARRMGGINLKVTIRPAYDVHCEEIADKLLWLFKDLCEASLYLPRNGSDLTQARVPDSTLMPMIISWALLQDWHINCRHEGSFESPRMSKDAFDSKHLKKLDGLLLMDYKFWKEDRFWLRQLWLGLCKVSTGRRAVASHYAFCYSKIIEDFMFRDREPEHTLLLLTVQLFSVPSVAYELVSKYDFMQRLHDLLTALMTGGVFPAFQTIEIPPPPPRQMQPQEEIQHPRLIIALRHIMYDIKYLVQSPGVQSLIVYDPRHTAYLLDWLRYFNGYAAEQRETVQHVEFDGETWVLIFQVCQLLAREAQLFGQSYQKATPAQAVQAINYIVARIHYEMQKCGVDDDARKIVPHDVKFGWPEAVYSVIDFVVASQPTAFHHPMCWFLAETSKRLSSCTATDLTILGISTVPGILTSVGESGLLAVVDLSMRCIVKLSQVRAGLWVRNGTSTRGQAAHYRDVSARFTMYDQDVFLLQSGLALMPSPDRLLVNALDRFSLVDYFDAAPSLPKEEQPADKAAAEDFLLLLITLLSEPGIVCAWTTEQLVRRELVHFLALGQGTFSSVTRFIPDHMIDHPSLEKILAQVAIYRGPDGTNDQGIYELRDECFQEVDPFFHHYTRNQRERAEEQLRHREKKAGRLPDDLVILPGRQFSLHGQVFAQSLLRTLVAPSFRYILFGGLNKSLKGETERYETELELIIHLIVIGIVEGGENFVRETLIGPIVNGSGQPEELSVLNALCGVEPQVKHASLKARIAWCIDQCGTVDSARESLTSRRIAKNMSKHSQTSSKGSSPAKTSMEAKRAAAKARQAAIMQKFSVQQQTLLQSLEKDEEHSKSTANENDSMELDAKGQDTAMAEADDEADREEALGGCIMCQEHLTESSSFGRLALISPSRILRTSPRNSSKALKDVVDVPFSLDRISPTSSSNARSTHIPPTSSVENVPYNSLNNLGTTGGGFSKDESKTGVLASSCGHLMHVNCFQTYYRNIETRHSQQIARNHAESLSRFEFVCPLCKSLGNLILPVPTSSKKVKKETNGFLPHEESSIGHQILDTTPIGDWLRKINIDILKTSGSQVVSGIQDGTSGGTGCFVSWYADNALSWLIDRDFGSKLPEGVDGSMLIMLGRLVDVLRPMSSSLRPQRVLWQAKTIIAPSNSRKLYLPEELVGYTLSVLEVSQRGLEAKSSTGELGNVATAISDGAMGLLRSLIYCLKSITAIDRLNPTLPPAAARGYQASLRQGLLKRLLPHWSSDEAVRSPLLLREPLSILIEAAAIVPESLGQVTTLMYYASLVQTVFGLAQPSIWPPASSSANRSQLFPSGISEQETAALQEIFPDVRWTVGHIVGFVGYARGNVTLGVDGLDDLTLAKMLCTYTLPFLRRAAVLRRAICGDSWAAPTSGLASDAFEPVEYLRLLSELQIIPLSQGLPLRADRQAPISSIVEGWIKHAYTPLASLFRPLPINPSPLGGGGGLNDPSSLVLGQTVAYTGQNHPTLQLEHPHIYELIALPKDLTALLMYTQRTTCRRCKTTPPEPALCLLCGQVVCYQSFCCMDTTLQKGECNLHLASCGGNYGIYFKVKSNLIFLLYHSNGTFIYSPYLDSHGEVDVGLTKGRRQTLYVKRYDDLRKVWLSGGIGTLVARKTEASMDPGGWDTT